MQDTSSSQKLIRQQIDDLIREIECQPNVFLQRELKDFMIQLLKCQELKCKNYFPNWFRNRISNLRPKLTDNHMTTPDILKQICQKFDNLKLPQASPNVAANILLDTTLSKRLSLKQSKKLVRLIETVKQDEKILAFIKQKYQEGVNEKDFVKQIKQKQYKGKKNINLNTLISQIIKRRPEEISAVEKLFKYRQNCKFFENRLIDVTSQNDDLAVNGRIIKASYHNNMYKFEAERFQDKLQIQIYLTNDSLHKIISVQQKLQPLKKAVYQLISKTNRKQVDKNQDFRIVSIRHNKNFYSNSTILPQNEYKLHYRRFSDGYQIIFQPRNQSFTQYDFLIFWKEGQIENIKCLNNRQYYTFDEFCNCYFVQLKTVKEFTFKNKQSIQRCFKISKSSAQDDRQILQKIQRLQLRKEKLIGKILSFDKERFNQLIEILIAKQQFSKECLQRLQIQEQTQHILQLSKQLGKYAQIQTLMSEILNKVNYTHLVNKDQTLNTIKAVQLFTKSQALTSSIKGKDIITFYGNTGSGKSTSVNYLIGRPLEVTKNIFGDTIVRQAIEDSQPQTKTEQHPKIGQSNGFSQTLFTKGFNILPEDQMQDKQLYENIVLCDNPGFRDTRGTEYEICTNLSMDRAIEVCKSIKAIVLIVPYQAITLDKGIPFLQLIHEIKSRFPNILNKQSNAFKNFHLLITKRASKSIDQKTIQERFSATLNQYKKHYSQTSKYLSSLQLLQQRQRINVYQIIVSMCKNKKIKFIDINNALQRQDILKKYVQNQVNISQVQYKKTLTDKHLMMKFVNQISVSAHNWSKLILEPYVSITFQIQQFKKQLGTKDKQLKQIESNIILISSKTKQQAGSYEAIKKQIQKTKTKLQLFIDNLSKEGHDTLSQSYLNQDNDEIQEFPFYVQDYEQRIKACNQKIKEIKQYIQVLRMEKQDNKELVQRQRQWVLALSYQAQELKTKISSWKQGEIDQIISQKKYKLGETVQLGSNSYTKAQRLQFIERGQFFPTSKTSYQFKCGQLQKKTCSIMKIQKKYALMPNKQFDPNQYISKNYSIFGKYKAIIESNKTQLQGVKLFQEGKVMFLSISKKYIVTNNQNDLPLLKITHKIPNEEHNSDLIRNADSQIRGKIKQICQLQACLGDLGSEIVKIDKDIKDQEQKMSKALLRLQQLLKVNKETRENEIKEKKAQKICKLQTKYMQQLKFLQSIKIDIYQQIQIMKKDNERNQTKKLKCQEEIKNLQIVLKQTKFKRKRLAFLIRDQIAKKIPQTLANFIEIAIGMIKQVSQQKLTKQADINYKIQNLKFFLEQYGKIKDTIGQQVDQHLNEK